jgi:hypothetical protein
VKLAQVAGGRPERVREAPGLIPPAPRMGGSALRDSHANNPLVAAAGIAVGSGPASERFEENQGSVDDTGLEATCSDRVPLVGEADGGRSCVNSKERPTP